MSKENKSSGFLIEIIFVTLFFSLAATSTLQLFVTAHKKSIHTQELNMALITLQTTIAQVQTETASGNELNSIYEESSMLNNCLTIEYDEDWNRVKTNGAFQVQIIIDKDDKEYGMVQTVQVAATNPKSQEVLCSLSAKQYLPTKKEIQ